MTKLKVLTRIRHDGKIYKAGETLELEDEATIERLVEHEAVEIIEWELDSNTSPNSNDDNDDEITITIEELKAMDVKALKKLAKDNQITLEATEQEEMAQELFDKLGEE